MLQKFVCIVDGRKSLKSYGISEDACQRLTRCTTTIGGRRAKIRMQLRIGKLNGDLPELSEETTNKNAQHAQLKSQHVGPLRHLPDIDRTGEE